LKNKKIFSPPLTTEQRKEVAIETFGNRLNLETKTLDTGHWFDDFWRLRDPSIKRKEVE
jgi:hypothetical protein